MNIHYFIPTESVKGCLKSQHEGPHNRLNFAKGHVNGSLTHLPGLAKPVAKLQQSPKMNVPALWFQGSEPLSPPAPRPPPHRLAVQLLSKPNSLLSSSSEEKRRSNTSALGFLQV